MGQKTKDLPTCVTLTHTQSHTARSTGCKPSEWLAKEKQIYLRLWRELCKPNRMLWTWLFTLLWLALPTRVYADSRDEVPLTLRHQSRLSNLQNYRTEREYLVVTIDHRYYETIRHDVGEASLHVFMVQVEREEDDSELPVEVECKPKNKMSEVWCPLLLTNSSTNQRHLWIADESLPFQIQIVLKYQESQSSQLTEEIIDESPILNLLGLGASLADLKKHFLFFYGSSSRQSRTIECPYGSPFDLNS
jgi:hypothetical protein